MARHTIYLDAYHELLLDTLADSKSLSKVITNALDSYLEHNWPVLPRGQWTTLVNSIVERGVTINVSKIPLPELKESVNKCHQAQKIKH